LWDIVAIASLILIFCTFFARLFLPHLNVFYIPDTLISDLFHVNFSQKVYLGHVLRENRLPFITSAIGNGFPLLAESQIGALNMLNFVLYKYLNPVVAFNLTYLIGFITMSSSLYFLGKYLFKSRFLAYVLSLSYSFSGIVMMQMTHQGILQAVFLLPAILYVFLRGQNKYNIRFSLFAGFLAGQQMLYGHFFVAIGTSVSIFLLAASDIYDHLADRKYLFNRVLYLGVYCISLLLVSLPQLIQTAVLTFQSSRVVGVDIGSFDIRYMLTLLSPYIFGSLSDGSFFSHYQFDSLLWDSNVFIGYGVLILAATSRNFIQNFKKIPKKFVLLLIFFAILMLGDMPIANYLSYIPPFSLFQYHSRFSLFTSLYAIIVLLYFAKNSIFIQKSRYTLFIQAFLIAFQIVVSFVLFYPLHPVISAKVLLSKPEIAKYIPKEAQVYSINFANLYNETFMKYGYKATSKYVDLHESLYPFSNLLYQTNNCSLFLYSNFSPELEHKLSIEISQTIHAFEKQHLTPELEQKLGLLGCHYVISSRKMSTTSERYGKTAYLTPIKAYLPLYRIYDKEIVILDEDTVLNILDVSKFDIQKAYVYESSNIPQSTNKSSHIVLENNSDSELAFKTKTYQKTLLFIRRSYYPGWHAYIDGNEVRIKKTNIFYMGIELPAGKHKVHLLYLPPYWNESIITSAIFYVAALFILVFYRSDPNS